MGVFDKLRESIFKVRVIPKPSAEDVTNFTPEKDSTINRLDDAINTGKRIDLSSLLNITTLKGTRNQKYAIFEEMVADGRIGAAVEMYANDTVQYNAEGKIVWIESDNAEVSQYCNKLIDDLHIADNIWSWAYCMWLYGDVYIETFLNTSNNNTKPTLLLEPVKANNSVRLQRRIQGGKLERYVEKVANPADMYDLQYKGKTSGFVRSQDEIGNTLNNNAYVYTGTTTNIDIMSPTKFVHICLSPNINRFPEKFKLVMQDDAEKVDENGYIDGSDSEGASGSLSFTVKSGQSVLENVYGPYQTLKLKEDSVLLERVTKASITRVIQVELGDLPESQKRKKLAEIKQQIEQQMQLNKDTGVLQSRPGAQPTENIIYTTTKNGKGTISTVNIGGEADVGNMEDITQSENKMFGALLTPKAALGADMDGTGLSNGGSLTELNTTYARRIKRGQVALMTGIKNLINIFALGDGLTQVVNNFDVKLTPIITVEDNRRDELLQDKIRNVSDMMSLFDHMDSIDETTKLDMLLQWLSTYLNQQDIVDIINKFLKESEAEEQSDSYDKQTDEMSVHDEDKPDINFNIDNTSAFDEEPEEIPFDTETTEEPQEEPNLEIPPQTDLAEIEGQDLL